VPNPFETPGVWLRCALHAHTTNSDGELSPRLLVRHYERAGFDVLAITDHRVRTEEPSTENLLVLPSTELDVRLKADRTAHVLGLGIAAEPATSTTELPTLEAAAAWITANGGVGYLAHPYWSGIGVAELDGLDGLAGLEVYNAGCELETGRGLSVVHWDEILESSGGCFAVAADDTHHPGFDSGVAWTWARAAGRSADAVLAALRDGASYSSTGPVLEDLYVDGRTVEVRCSPARRVTLLTGPRRGASVVAGKLGYRHAGDVLERDSDGAIIAARLTAPAKARYARLEVHDASGATAWTNPLWH
jgi:predicted metal-dependent phosphoesterase TrpH